MKSNQSGFTLIELLIALALTSLLLTISYSASLKTYDSIQYHQFIEEFDQDLLYLQQLAMTKKENYYLHFERENNRYLIRKGGLGSKILVRNYPSDWQIELDTLKMPIKFSSKGNFSDPGTMKIKTKTSVYFITCPFGKGRCYDKKT
ncbi:competence type IV pilus minor pilin ComGD [Gracilibacillus kekensis]|uniref:Competence protein ComGD n=1 Tax=Gracilibacillus kekensis TaxID=1027249 RepID=A0A1M7P5W8_9BACI|nr:competence type IV pilus minor pilin ComGD [Gracilibacillus kekensis]SHN12053.1 competence protein ComGD [Gracilibacillus kekensis]